MESWRVQVGAQASPPDFLGSQVQDQLGHLGLNSVCGAQFETHWRLNSMIYVSFQQDEDFVGQRRQLLGDRLQFAAARRTRNPVQTPR